MGKDGSSQLLPRRYTLSEKTGEQPCAQNP